MSEKTPLFKDRQKSINTHTGGTVHNAVGATTRTYRADTIGSSSIQGFRDGDVYACPTVNATQAYNAEEEENGDKTNNGVLSTYQNDLDVVLKNPILENGVKDPRTGVYKTRWYILFMLSMSTTLQHAVWASWGPIAQSAKAVYGWKTSTLALMINCGNIGVLLFLIFAAYIVGKKGLRVSMVLCTFLLAMGAGLRVITMDPVPATILIGAGQFCNGLAGSLTQVVPPFISETWFPANERTTATAIGVLSNAFGGAAAFILGPNLVSQPQKNGSYYNNPSYNGTYSKDFDTIKHQIWILNIIECTWGVILFLLSLLYFPAKPPFPPSKSASVRRPNFKHSLSKLARQFSIWQLVVISAIPWAVCGNWLSMLDTILHDVGVTQTQAGWYGFYSCLAGIVGGTLLGRIADIVQRRLKLMLACLYFGSLLSVLWITYMAEGYIPRSNTLFAVAITLLGVLMNGAMPLAYETACEMAYPVSEEITTLFIGLGINATAVVFMLVQLVPDIGTAWMNWCFLGVLTLSVPLLLALKERYNRTNVDHGWKSEVSIPRYQTI